MSAKKTASDRKTVYLVDGTYLVFRSFFAIGPLNAPDGTPTSGVYGFVNTLRRLERELQPDYLAVAFDVDGPTHRDDAYAEYKANRQPPPSDLVPQFPLAREACAVLGWPDLSAEGFEADDVLATLAQQAVDAGLKPVIVTADKDLYQLVDDAVVVLNPMKNDRLLDPDGVEEVFGVRPEHVIDVLALMGDAVDNVPGVPGVGAKTAKTMVQRYGSAGKIGARAAAFAAFWQAKQAAIAAIDAKQSCAKLLVAAKKAAGELAALEPTDDDAGRDLAERLTAAAKLDADDPRSAKKLLRQAEKKTQPKTWLAIAEHAEQLALSLELVTVRADAPVELSLPALERGRVAASPAVELFSRLGFKKIVEELADSKDLLDQTLGASLEVDVLTTKAALKKTLADVAETGCVSVDTETDSLDARNAKLVGISMAEGHERGAYLPVGHARGQQLAWDDARPLVADVFEDASIGKVGQNLKYDRAVLRGAGIELQGIVFDTMIAAQLVDPGRTTSHKLDDLAQRYLGERMISYQQLAGEGDAQQTLDQLDVEQVARYAVEDSVVVQRLIAPLSKELRQRELEELFEQVEIPLVPVLEEMEHHGIRLDVATLDEMSAQMADQLQALEKQIYELAGHEFNIGSPQQLRTVLFDELDLKPTGRRTQKTRKHSTGAEALEALTDVHPLPGKVIEYREISKLKSTYVDALPKLVDAKSSRIHTSFHQLGAATGRLSSSDPNLQNIPIRTEAGRKIREAFVPEPGWSFVSADYSQMELRILAHLSQDPALISAFEEDLDIHRYTAALVADVPMDEVSDEMRARAKAVNFGIVYGMSEFRLAREQDMTREEARMFIANYFARYPQVRQYIDGVVTQVKATGEVRTLYGRVRDFPDLVEGSGARLNRMVSEQLVRQAVNTTVQGTGADIVKRAMVAVSQRLADERLRARLLLQVHDELLLESPPDEADEVAALVREEMESAARLDVPLRADVRIAENWARAH